MFKLHTNDIRSVDKKLRNSGYWPIMAHDFLQQSLYSKAVEICRENLETEPNLISGRLIYARALFYAGQFESSRKQINIILSKEPNNITALKYLGDLNFNEENYAGATACYEKVLSINPVSRALKSKISLNRNQTTSTIKLIRKDEFEIPEKEITLREIYFYTETIGDLYLNQGFPRLAAEVFKRLEYQQNNPRINDKLKIAEEKIKEKDQKYVKKTDR